MSRIGRKPIPVPSGVKVRIEDGVFTAEGPKGKVAQPLAAGIGVVANDNQLEITRQDDERQSRALHGLMRALVANAVQGVAQGFSKNLDIVGVGYRAEVKGRELHMALGYSHPVVYPLPKGIDVAVDDSDPGSSRAFSYFDWAGIAPANYAQPRRWKTVRLSP